MSNENVKLLEAVNEIKNKLIGDLQAYEHDAMRSPSSFVYFYMDLSAYCESGVKICETFCKEQNTLKLVKELIFYGFLKEVLKLKQHIDDEEVLKIIWEAELLEKIKEELNVTVEDIRKQVFE
jgi:hypothetical protein